jgi:hypothetical protein
MGGDHMADPAAVGRGLQGAIAPVASSLLTGLRLQPAIEVQAETLLAGPVAQLPGLLGAVLSPAMVAMPELEGPVVQPLEISE